MARIKKDARAAAEEIRDLLKRNKGFYVWTSMGDPATWFLRIPRRDGDSKDTVLEKEKAEFVHVCSPLKFLEAFHSKDKKTLASCSGYVRDDTCIRCHRRAPEDVSKKINIQVKLDRVAQKIT